MRTRTKPRNDARASTGPVDPDPQLDWIEHFFGFESALLMTAGQVGNPGRSVRLATVSANERRAMSWSAIS